MLFARSHLPPLIGAALLAVILVSSTVTCVAAKDPAALGPGGPVGPAPNGVSAHDPAVGPEQLGYSDSLARAKQEAAARSASAATGSSGLQPLTTSNALPYWWQIHQFTSDRCLSAFLQSVMGQYYPGYTSGTLTQIHTVQENIHGAIGTDEDAALAWLNNELKKVGSSWYYVWVQAPDSTTFNSHVVFDVNAGWPMFARVNLLNKNYVWYQTGTTAVWHATGAAGYSGSGSYVNISDPFWTPDNATGCVRGLAPSGKYDPNALNGCVYVGYSSYKYYMSEIEEWY